MLFSSPVLKWISSFSYTYWDSTLSGTTFDPPLSSGPPVYLYDSTSSQYPRQLPTRLRSSVSVCPVVFLSLDLRFLVVFETSVNSHKPLETPPILPFLCLRVYVETFWWDRLPKPFGTLPLPLLSILSFTIVTKSYLYYHWTWHVHRHHCLHLTNLYIKILWNF